MKPTPAYMAPGRSMARERGIASELRAAITCLPGRPRGRFWELKNGRQTNHLLAEGPRCIKSPIRDEQNP